MATTPVANRPLPRQPGLDPLPQRLARRGFELQAKGAAQALHRIDTAHTLALRAVADTPGLALPTRQVLAVVEQQRVAEQLLGRVLQHLFNLPGRGLDDGAG